MVGLELGEHHVLVILLIRWSQGKITLENDYWGYLKQQVCINVPFCCLVQFNRLI
jgi:hypothetical protein